MSEYKPGSMNISEQRETFHGFVKACVYLSVIVALVLIFLALVAA